MEEESRSSVGCQESGGDAGDLETQENLCKSTLGEKERELNQEIQDSLVIQRGYLPFAFVCLDKNK